MYNEIVQNHYRNPRNLGRIEGADGVGEVSIREPSTDWLQVSLRLNGTRITEARFRAIGCAATVAAGSAMTEWLVGRPVSEAAALTPGTVLDVLGGLPEDKHYCADLASRAIRAAVAHVASSASARGPQLAGGDS